jgi:hypothetical protein
MNNSVRAGDDTPSDLPPRLLARRPLSVCVPGLTARLRALGICQVQMEYRGADFQGGFIRMDFYRPDGTGMRPTDPAVHSTALQAIFRYLLSVRHPNWIEGDGSTGDFRWDLSTDSLIHTHYLRGANGNERITHHDL